MLAPTLMFLHWIRVCSGPGCPALPPHWTFQLVRLHLCCIPSRAGRARTGVHPAAPTSLARKPLSTPAGQGQLVLCPLGVDRHPGVLRGRSERMGCSQGLRQADPLKAHAAPLLQVPSPPLGGTATPRSLLAAGRKQGRGGVGRGSRMLQINRYCPEKGHSDCPITSVPEPGLMRLKSRFSLDVSPPAPGASGVPHASPGGPQGGLNKGGWDSGWAPCQGSPECSGDTVGGAGRS